MSPAYGPYSDRVQMRMDVCNGELGQAFELVNKVDRVVIDSTRLCHDALPSLPRPYLPVATGVGLLCRPMLNKSVTESPYSMFAAPHNIESSIRSMNRQPFWKSSIL